MLKASGSFGFAYKTVSFIPPLSARAAFCSPSSTATAENALNPSTKRRCNNAPFVYATTQLNLPRTLLLKAIFIAALVEVSTIPLFGWLSDHIGRRIFYFLGTLFTACFAFPLFWFLSTKDPQTVILTVVVALSFGHGTMFGLQSAYFPELFGTRVRYSGASFGFQLSAALGGGFSPIIATALAGYMGGTAGVSMMLILLALITFIATLFATETKNRSLID